jgi:DNA-binding NarL/FixJ family response regulator
MEGEAARSCRVFVVDDHPAVREGLALLLGQRGITLCGEAADAAQTLARLGEAQPDVTLVDLSLQRASGIALIEALHGHGQAVLVYSMHEDAVHIKRAFAAGAGGYVSKREGTEALVQAIHEVAAGRRYLSRRVQNALVGGESDSAEARLLGLSDRETLVLRWLGQGDSGDEIARRLHISPRTVETYCGRIMEKLGLAGMKELRRYAIQQAQEELVAGGGPAPASA